MVLSSSLARFPNLANSGVKIIIDFTITQDGAMDHSPVWSPNGEQIVFVSDRDGDDDLYVMDADGRRVRRVFRKSAYRTEPTWSPDGETIAFHAQEPQWSIQTATANGTDVEEVAQAGSAGGNPSVVSGWKGDRLCW